MGNGQYENFDLRIRSRSPRAKASYVVDADGAEQIFKYPFAADREENIGHLAGARMTSNRRGSDDQSRQRKAKEIGEQVFKCLLDGKVRERWLARRVAAEKKLGAGVRLRIRCHSSVPEALGLPWEFAWDSDLRKHLALSAFTPIVRCLDLPGQAPPPLKVNGRLRVLVLISQPSGFRKLQGIHELRALTKLPIDILALKEGDSLTKLLGALSAANDENKPFHVLHYIGHGKFNEQTRRGELLFEGPVREAEPVDALRLGGILQSYPSIRLAVLNCCEGARAARHDLFAGFAQGLVQQGLPAVVGMQYNIPDDTASEFARVFYDRLSNGKPAEAALAEARQHVWTTDGMEWATPVMYVHPDCDQIFKISSPPPNPGLPITPVEPTRRKRRPDAPPPAGALEPNSPFRISREEEGELDAIMHATGVAILVSAPGQFGRTTVLRSLEAEAKRANKKPIWINFSVFSSQSFLAPATFFTEFAEHFGQRFGRVDSAARVKEIWSTPDPNHVTRCIQFVQETLATQPGHSFSLILDAFDRLLGTEVKADFCRLIRVWENDRPYGFDWSRMDVIMSTSEEPWRLDLRNFREVWLQPFDEEQIKTLARRYRLRLTGEQLDYLSKTMAGHPGLVHGCLSKARAAKVKHGEIFSPDREPLSSLLASVEFEVRRGEQSGLPLRASLKEIKLESKCSDERAFLLLRALGILGRSQMQVNFTCPLYREYFGS